MDNTKFENSSTLIEELRDLYDRVSDTCQDVDSELFNSQINNKWSIQDNLEHLILSSKPVAKALRMPKENFAAYGHSSSGSRPYDVLVAAYLNKLKEGGKSIPPFNPGNNSDQIDSDQLLEAWGTTFNYMAENLKDWTEEDLDTYRLPHPLLGNLTIREMLCFTHYHTNHHLQHINHILQNQ